MLRINQTNRPFAAVGVYRNGRAFEIRVSYWAYMDALKAGFDPRTRPFWAAVARHQDTRTPEVRRRIVNQWRRIVALAAE